MMPFEEMNSIGKEHAFIEPLGENECETVGEIRRREGEHIEAKQPELNTRKAGRDTTQYYKDKQYVFQQRYENN